MIQLTRLNNQPLAVNSDLIKFVEQAPDTVITLVSGEKIVVRESANEILERIVRFRRSVLKTMASEHTTLEAAQSPDKIASDTTASAELA